MLLKYLGIFQPYNINLQQLFKLPVKKLALEFFLNHIIKSLILKTTIQMPINLTLFQNIIF